MGGSKLRSGVHFNQSFIQLCNLPILVVGRMGHRTGYQIASILLSLMSKPTHMRCICSWLVTCQMRPCGGGAHMITANSRMQSREARTSREENDDVHALQSDSSCT